MRRPAIDRWRRRDLRPPYLFITEDILDPTVVCRRATPDSRHQARRTSLSGLDRLELAPVTVAINSGWPTQKDGYMSRPIAPRAAAFEGTQVERSGLVRLENQVGERTGVRGAAYPVHQQPIPQQMELDGRLDLAGLPERGAYAPVEMVEIPSTASACLEPGPATAGLRLVAQKSHQPRPTGSPASSGLR